MLSSMPINRHACAGAITAAQSDAAPTRPDANDMFRIDSNVDSTLSAHRAGGNAVSRRKQQQLDTADKHQHDKYAVETELDMDALQQIGDSEQLDLSRQVRLSVASGRHIIEALWISPS